MLDCPNHSCSSLFLSKSGVFSASWRDSSETIILGWMCSEVLAYLRKIPECCRSAEVRQWLVGIQSCSQEGVARDGCGGEKQKEEVVGGTPSKKMPRCDGVSFTRAHTKLNHLEPCRECDVARCAVKMCVRRGVCLHLT